MASLPCPSSLLPGLDLFLPRSEPAPFWPDGLRTSPDLSPAWSRPLPYPLRARSFLLWWPRYLGRARSGRVSTTCPPLRARSLLLGWPRPLARPHSGLVSTTFVPTPSWRPPALVASSPRLLSRRPGLHHFPTRSQLTPSWSHGLLTWAQLARTWCKLLLACTEHVVSCSRALPAPTELIAARSSPGPPLPATSTPPRARE